MLIDQELINIFQRLPRERKELFLEFVRSFQLYEELKKSENDNSVVKSLSSRLEKFPESEDLIYKLLSLNDKKLNFVLKDLEFTISNLKDLNTGDEHV